MKKRLLLAFMAMSAVASGYALEQGDSKICQAGLSFLHLQKRL